MVIGLGSNAGNPGSNLVDGCIRTRVYVGLCTVYFYVYLCEFFLFDHAYFFATYSAKGQNVSFCPATLLTNESLVQSVVQSEISMTGRHSHGW